MNFLGAQKRVAQAIKDNATKLVLNSFLQQDELTDDDLRKLLPEILKIPNLTTLDLSYNKLCEVSFLKSIKSLIEINLSNNNLSDISFLEELENLVSADLRENNLSVSNRILESFKVPQYIFDFIKVKEKITQAIEANAVELNLNETFNISKLTESDLSELISDILKIKKLQILRLANNHLTNLDKQFAELKTLKELHLNNNNLSGLDEEFAKLTNLRLLNLSSNNLTEFSRNFASLTDLETINLSGNELTTLDKRFAKLPNLKHLNLRNNNIAEFDKEFAGAKQLETLLLEKNKLTNFDKSFVKLENLYQLDLRSNHLPYSEEILKNWQNAQKLLVFIKDYYSNKRRKLNEAKLVIIGEANVGKTCLINRLIRNEFVKTDRTHGIRIEKWKGIKLKNKEMVQMNVWDFGGQEIMHTTHQFFFTKRTIYILVINARENEDTNKTEEWLQRIQNLSHNSPVFIVGNKIDENNFATHRNDLGYFDIDKTNLRKKFPNIIKGFYGITSNVELEKYNHLFARFKSDLISEIEKLGNIHDEFPESWFDVKSMLEKMQEDKKPYIEFSKYITYCAEAGINDSDNQETWIEFLNDLGVALTYRDDNNLNYISVLNPEWITKGVYALIDNPQIVLKNGILKREEIKSFINDGNGYPPKTHEFIIKMMRKFQLLIEIDENKYLIPDLLPIDEPEIGSWDDTLHFQYSYEIYEKSILRRAIVKLFEMCPKEQYWRNGIILVKGDNRALVKADVKEKTISIKIDGNPNTRREFIAVIRSKFDEIHASFDGISFEEMLGHPKHPQILRDDYRLRSMEVDQIEKEYVVELRRMLSVKDWLNGFYSVEERQQKEVSSIYIIGDNNEVIQGVSNSEIHIRKKIVDEVSPRMNESQQQLMESLADEVIRKVEIKESANITNETLAELEEAKKGKWETKLKFSIPFIPLVFSRDIPPDEFIAKVQKWLYGGDLQTIPLKD